ncbi:MAG: aspartyl/glutamyl-tRNA(Asn/Gln) amidotransferase subunit [Candidatus Taylorbacteria bacterium]|nr:aspartyl/glutamyl-tRNA(Asn/Gln) amidotransferase subunit [Candidatus Taylorbacteria bacterium]
MISKIEIEKLANLSRLALTLPEKDSFSNEIGAILGYISNINSLVSNDDVPQYAHKNILREDLVLHTTGEYTDRLVANAPEREGNFVKVKKILG